MTIAKRTLATAAQAAAKTANSAATPSKRIAFIDGVRIPFQPAGTVYNDLIGYDLGRLATKGLVDKTAIDAKEVDYLCWGTVIQEVKTNNVAREITLGAGLPQTIPSHTVGLACISSGAALASASEKILAGRAGVAIIGGSETFSDVPIRFSKPVRQRLIGLGKAMKKGPAGVMKLLKGLKLKDLAPEPPAIKNFSTNEVMGHSSDRLAARFGVTRQAQDEFAVASHLNAAKAHAEGYYKGEVLPYKGKTDEGLIKGDTSLEKAAKLKPAFVKPHGTHTAANSSPLTDGAAAALIMGSDKAQQLGYTPKSYINDWNFVSVDPFEEMLLGPAYAIAKILKKNKLTLDDIDVFEIHEAFAGQVLSNLAALNSEEFCKENLGMDLIGEVPLDKVNQWGGSVSIGHPFGATVTRCITTATNRLIREDGKLALVAACADGGQAFGCIVERS